MDKKYRTFAEIDLDALDNNLSELKRNAGDNIKLCGVIKADGYGHGSVTLGKYIQDRVDFFAVATADEAIELRNNSITKPILILSYVHESEYEDLIKNNVSLTVFTLRDAKNINAEAQKLSFTANIHIAIDTGMSRIGFAPTDESLETIKEISKMSNIHLQGIFSHFACADMTDKTVTKSQEKCYTEFVAKCENAGVHFDIHHLCNSAAISENKNHFDMVRMGVSLYGLYPSEEIDKSLVNLKPVMTFKSHVIYVKTVKKGAGISYGHTYHADSDRIIATVCAGYADGYPRAMSNKGVVIINGQKAKIVGRVCMDQFMVDVTDLDVNIDDEVVLFGDDDEINAEYIGQNSASFNYEVVCNVSRRVPRVYIKDGKIVEVVNYLR